MKKIINGRRYDTEAAEKVAEAYSNLARNDFGYWEEELYRKRTGEFFLYGWGGPASRYSKTAGLNSWSGGEKIRPLTIEEAQKWVRRDLRGGHRAGRKEDRGTVAESGCNRPDEAQGGDRWDHFFRVRRAADPPGIKAKEKTGISPVSFFICRRPAPGTLQSIPTS